MSVVLEKNFEFFLNYHFDEYKEGEWVAIYGDKVISHGERLKDVLNEVKKIVPVSKVLFSKVKKTASYLKTYES